MTSIRKSSPPGLRSAANAGRSLLGEAYHPHAIEVQDFAFYGAMFDVRSQDDYDEDHIPGARHVDIGTSDGSSSSGGKHGLPDGLTAALYSVDVDRTILIYCDYGGRISEPTAAALRRMNWRVDVLPGGYVNYRRWVQAGLDVLPRLVSWRTFERTPDSARQAMQVLRRSGHQVLDLEEIAGSGDGQTGHRAISQAGFESRLVEVMRRIDARSPVCVAPSRLGRLLLPAVLARAVAAAPAMALRDVAPVET